ncbi:glyceraldehyde-3-phosphate dehydrogenase (NADP+) [Paraburkholderia unamae]|uniref:NADP-dependent glyceraldehyde-3-phosphate dehydrogenase n=1 Tax=Paraburkholderia unamae TaxID=219649 RepID=UPI000DC59FA2|nr:NADP-dependent glyceraldehyde-3-phosphate dehydrogenase [Paraburkholderia unamae]RAR47917.1 glyceraldehyde-3-phosphate dehydrogenase (NADP+) [Paraburkholderia unamae]
MTTNPELSALFPLANSIPADARVTPLHQRETLVSGEMRRYEGDSKTVLSAVHFRQADGSLSPVELGSYPLGGTQEARDALDAAVSAYDSGRGRWPTMTVAGRIACVEHFARLMVERRDEVIRLIMWEIGKTKSDAQKEFDRTVQYIAATVDALKELDNGSSRFQVVDGTIAQIRRAPLGVVLCMGPYNYPLNETFTTLIPALIMGNTVVLKPPKFGALLFYPLLFAFQKAFPPGVINTVYGRGEQVVPYLMGSGDINVLALIGSSRVADTLKKAHPKSNRLRAVLGLDAKNPAIVLPDANLDVTVRECVAGALSFNGQRCTALKIIFVHRSIADTFVARLSKAVNSLRCGMPWESGVQVTPLPDQQKPAYLGECVSEAVRLGACVVNDGGGDSAATMFRPAVVFPVDERMRLYHEEQFGPVVPVVPFDDVREPLEYVIRSPYGQQVSLFGNDAQQIGTLTDQLVNQVCRVNLNCQCQRGPDVFPFAGRKDSAEGTLSVSDALRAFSIRSMVASKHSADDKALLNAIVDGRRSNFVSTGFLL